MINPETHSVSGTHTNTHQTSVGIVTINAQYAHTHPGIRILRNIAHDCGLSDAWIREFTLADPVWKMTEMIVAQNPKILGISISIWNRTSSLALARRVKSILPNTLIIAGGPEVWFEPGTLEGIDSIIPGDGEKAWLKTLQREFNISYKCSNYNSISTSNISNILEPIPPYRECDFPDIKGRMVYLETSRGCPFRCAFCHSGRADVPYQEWFPGTCADLANTVATLTQHGAHTIKFLDRTFNANTARALQYFRELAKVDKAVCHFEICAELLDNDTLDFLATVPPGKFQFEIGIQSLNIETLKAIGRRTDTHLLLEKLRRLVDLKTVHVHADLIWGLPQDTQKTIVNTFNTLHDFGFDELQLGFLKFLRGTTLANEKEKYGYTMEPDPPYEALSHKNLSSREFLDLHKVEYVFNRFHNSKRFPRTIRYLMRSENFTPFAFFEKIAQEFAAQNWFLPALTIEKQCEILHTIFGENKLLLDYLRLDYTCSQKVFTLPKLLTFPHTKTSQTKAPPVKLERGEHCIFVVFEHTLDLEKMEFLQERNPAVHKITHRAKSGYFSDICVEKTIGV